jgi:hypothetical protein
MGNLWICSEEKENCEVKRNKEDILSSRLVLSSVINIMYRVVQKSGYNGHPLNIVPFLMEVYAYKKPRTVTKSYMFFTHQIYNHLANRKQYLNLYLNPLQFSVV